MSKVTWPAGTLLAPVPAVLVTCGTMEKPNALTIAWTGTINSTPPRTYISVRPERYSHDIIRDSGEFVINLTTGPMTRATDYCGVRSGRDGNKLQASGLELEASEIVKAPMLKASPLTMECRVFDVIPLGSHDMFLADILAVHVEESLLDGAGKLHLEKAGLMAHIHGAYYLLGKRIGQFGFSVRKKRPKNPAGPKKK